MVEENGNPIFPTDPSRREPPSRFFIILVTAVMLAAFVGTDFLFGDKMPWLPWVSLVVCFVAIVAYGIFPDGRALWPLLKSVFGGKPLMVVKTDEEGNHTVKCPGCSNPVTIHPCEPGKLAFECKNCGEKMAWQDVGETPVSPDETATAGEDAER